MSNEDFNAVPKGQENSFMLLSVGFLAVVFTIIGGFIAKLWYDERRSSGSRETNAMMDEIFADTSTSQPRDNRRNRASNRAQADAGTTSAQSEEAFGNFQPGRSQQAGSDDDEEGGDENTDAHNPFDKKFGKKKLAKLQAKADARAEREAMIAQREEKKKREEEARKEREEQEKVEAEAARQEAEEEKRRREEQEAKEHEAYLKMKADFGVIEEGFEQNDENAEENLMASFLEYVKKHKAVNVDELASMFKLKVEDTMERLQYFLSEGKLTGVIDDRGKFIYITQEELNNVAKFVTQRGRISTSDLVDYSNRLISLDAAIVEAQ